MAIYNQNSRELEALNDYLKCISEGASINDIFWDGSGVDPEEYKKVIFTALSLMLLIFNENNFPTIVTITGAGGLFFVLLERPRACVTNSITKSPSFIGRSI